MNISNYLKASPELAAVTQHAERLIALQHLFEAVAPPALAQQCRVANFKQGKLVILAANALVAAKLRQVVPSLSDEFSNRGWKVTAIQVGVQDRPLAPPPAASMPVPPGANARARLAAFARAAEPRLRAAVEHLLRVACGSAATPGSKHPAALRDEPGEKDQGEQQRKPE